jgi:hypothetical protein
VFSFCELKPFAVWLGLLAILAQQGMWDARFWHFASKISDLHILTCILES